jgi:hypothetical protein
MEYGDDVHEFNNLVVNSASSVLLGLLQRDFGNFAPTNIGIGDGGDLEQDAKIDSGARVAPAATDTEIRSAVSKVPITQVEVDATNPNKITYIAVAKPTEAVTPSINELTLESANGTLISHFVTESDSTGRARKYPKSSLEYLIIRWTIELTVN